MTVSMKWVTAVAGARSTIADEQSIFLQGLLLAREKRTPTLLLFVRPASMWQVMPLERETAEGGIDLLCATTRFARNEALATFEEMLLDIGAWVRTAREAWGYEKILLLGWSGSGTISAFYQAQAERPTLDAIADGRPLRLSEAALVPADGLIFQGAHSSRARMLADLIDPSILDESCPSERDATLDLYAPDAPSAPYDAGFLARYRLAQKARISRISARARAQLADPDISRRQQPFIVERTMADPYYLDPTIDPNGRQPGRCWLGRPEDVNVSPGGIARVATAESWLSQWSIEDSPADAVRSVATMRCPLLVIENSADDAVPPSHVRDVHTAAGTDDKSFARIDGASHNYAGQPDQLRQATAMVRNWAQERGLA